jgi:AcrR family transcriptional regulator
MVPRHKDIERKGIIEKTRKAILVAAGKEFALKGYEGANVNHIAKSAGYSIGTVYNYFPGKRELMEAFIDEVGGRHVDHIIEVVMRKDGSAERVEAFFQAGFDYVSQNLAESRGIFNTLHGPDEGFKHRLYQVYAPLFALVQGELLDRGFTDGTFTKDVPGSTAGLIMLIYLGVGSQFTHGRTHRVNAQEVADFVNRALAAG